MRLKVTLDTYLQCIEPGKQSFPRARHFFQEVLSPDHVENLGQEQVLGRVSHPRVEDPVGLFGVMGQTCN